MTDATPREEVRASELVGDRSEAAVAALVDEHQGAMSRLARLVGRDRDAGGAVRRAWAAALARPGEQPEGTSVRGWLLTLVIDELELLPAPAELPLVAPAADFEEAGGRWAGWWKDDLPATPEPEPALLESALARIPQPWLRSSSSATSRESEPAKRPRSPATLPSASSSCCTTAV